MRRIVVLVLLFVMVLIGAAGVSGLLGRLFDVTAQRLAGSDTAGLALNLAFTVIAVPLAALLWVGIRRSLRRPGERSSLAWGLYVAAILTISLITFSIAMLSFLSAAVRGEWAASDLANALTWLAVWMWHTVATRSPSMKPARLVGAAPVLGTAFGVLLASGGAIAALAELFDAAVDSLVGRTSVGTPVGEDVLRALVWAVGGAAVWWWHWRRENARDLRSTLAAVALVALGGFLSPAAAIGGGATVLYVLLRLGLDRSDSAEDVTRSLGMALAVLLVGATLWTLYRPVLRSRTEPRQAARLLSSGVALVTAAIGVGVLVNAILAVVAAPVVGERPLTLLLAGAAALLVGGPAWWFLWRPLDDGGGHGSGRRVYLVIVFGVSALVALITLLVIGYRVFESVLGAGPGGLLDRVRTPVGLLAATVLVAGYHFAVWSRDRRSGAIEGGVVPRIRRIYLVAGPDGPLLAARLHEDTGAVVTLLRRPGEESDASLGEGVRSALEGVNAPAVLVLAGPAGRLEVIPVQVDG